MMKKTRMISALLALCLVLTSACGAKSEPKESLAPPAPADFSQTAQQLAEPEYPEEWTREQEEKEHD